MKKYLSIFFTLMIIILTTSCSSNKLDTTWECDYLKIAKCSKWEEESEIDGNHVDIKWELDDESINTISLYLGKSISGKESQSDLQEFYERLNEKYEGEYEIFDNFVKNGQAYVITGSKDSARRTVHFSAEKVEGDIYYSAEDEELVMKMIDSIEFY